MNENEDIYQEVCDRIGNNIKYIREMKDMSQRELARQSGYSANFLCLVERKHKALSLEALVTIAKTLKISPETLISVDLSKNS